MNAHPSRFGEPADANTIFRTVAALQKTGITVHIADNRQEARDKALEIVPAGAEVMNNTSTTFIQLGLDKDINESGRYVSVRNKLMTVDRKTHDKEAKCLAATALWAVGSVHAITEQGQLMIASATGSQIPSYCYTAANVLWIAGTQKIVKDLDEGFRRIHEYVFPLEDERSLKAYGSHSGVNKIFILNRETVPGRLNMLLVKEKLGF